jgi:hypothetical protein
MRLFETKFTFERRTMSVLYKYSVPTEHYGTLSTLVRKTNHLMCIRYKVKEQKSLNKPGPALRVPGS